MLLKFHLLSNSYFTKFLCFIQSPSNAWFVSGLTDRIILGQAPTIFTTYGAGTHPEETASV